MLGPKDLVLSSGAIENPPVETLVEAASAGGYRGITLWPGAYHPNHHPGCDPKELHARCDGAGLVLHDLDAIVVWAGPDDPGAPYYEEALEREVYEMAEALDVDGVTLLLHSSPVASVDAASAAFAAACDRAAEHGLNVHLEFGRARVPSDIAEAARVVEQAGRANSGLMIDAWHVHWGSGSFADLMSLVGSRVTGVQLCDAPETEPADYGWATRHKRVVPGRGAADLRTLLRNLNAIGCEAPICLEVFDTSRVEEIGPIAWACELADAARALLA